MFHNSLLSRSLRYAPMLIAKRWKVRNLTKEHYSENETPYMRFQKPVTRTITADFYAIVHRKNLSWAMFKNWRKWKKIDQMRADQKYMPERHKALGPDLAATHFFIARGGKIKFEGNEQWFTVDDIETEKIPSIYTPGYYIEELDASDTILCYEGFDNLWNLKKIKKLHLRNCCYIDDWCLSRTHLLENTLEYLDISGCHLVTERGICTLHSLKKMKTLIIRDTPNIQNRELVSLLLQDVIPECDIIGVDFNDPVFLKRIETFLH